MWRISTLLRLAGLTKPIQQPEDVLAAAQRRGTQVHAINEAFAYGSIMPGPHGLDAYVDGLRLWYAEAAPHVLFAERRIINRAMRANGKPDVGILCDNEPVIVDVKTGGMLPSYGIQVAGYTRLADQNSELRLQAYRRIHGEDFPFGKNYAVGDPAMPRLPKFGRAILLLPGNGSYEWVGESKMDRRDYYLFDSALALVQWRFDHGIITETDPENPEGAHGSSDTDLPF